MKLQSKLATLGLALAMTQLAACAGMGGGSDPVVDNSHTSQALDALPRHTGPKRIVTIYEFRSSVPEVQAGGATDMFTTALIKSGAFAVAERSRLAQGVMAEKQLNASGTAAGSSAANKVAGADYIFEGTVSEANQSGSQNGGGLSFGGLNLGGGNNKDSIGVDVRIVDASNGLVIDSVDVQKNVGSTQTSVSGLGSLIGSVAGRPVDANVQTGRREGVDQAVRACMESAVAELVKRYSVE
jgi:curli biogenesis system outer membrane secretion channel CsgG